MLDRACCSKLVYKRDFWNNAETFSCIDKPSTYLLLSYQDLRVVELQLLEILSSVSLEAVVASLSTLSQSWLKTLEIEYSSLVKGSCKYLEDLVARLDTPSLQECCMLFFCELVFDVPQLTQAQFICRAEALRSPGKASILSSESVSFRFWQGRLTGSPIVGSFSLSFPYFHLNQQLSCKFHAIDSPPKEPDWLDDAGAEEWTSIFASCVAVRELCVSEPLGQHVAQALTLPRTTGQAEMLPTL
ncbi:hypothetical protein EDB92DRAFT_1909685 [Lactarius akahatsu]|uniref:Uncharacterized protein n=1 Tax=Lactarius akahatsu TaxID=416441 RepID=A0AAD4L8P3_9AGAM|nr:hypothetical protein EDB92DRAFT_1909685 [Lactarius akahatsu]